MDYFTPQPPGREKLIEKSPPVERYSPDDAEYFFGYFDKSPWNSRGELLGHKVCFSHRQPRFGDKAELGKITSKTFAPFAATSAWCWQMGSMLQYMDDDSVIFNDWEDDKFVSRHCRIADGKILKTWERPIYCLSPDKRFALSTDFARLDRERPGYGYTGVWHSGLLNAAPDNDGIWKLDLASGKSELLFSYRQLQDFCHVPSSYSQPVWVNHLLISPDGKRFVFVLRWRLVCADRGMRFETMLLTAGTDGTDLFLLNNEGMSSHYTWIDPQRIICFADRCRAGYQYYIFTDKSCEETPLSPGAYWGDGHCTFSRDHKWMLSDSYPWPGNSFRSLYLRCNQTGTVYELGRFFADPKLPNPARCDLHPRLSADNRLVCFDSVHEGKRGIYIMDISEITGEK